jgi:hypothetical protein
LPETQWLHAVRTTLAKLPTEEQHRLGIRCQSRLHSHLLLHIVRGTIGQGKRIDRPAPGLTQKDGRNGERPLRINHVINEKYRTISYGPRFNSKRTGNIPRLLETIRLTLLRLSIPRLTNAIHKRDAQLLSQPAGEIRHQVPVAIRGDTRDPGRRWIWTPAAGYETRRGLDEPIIETEVPLFTLPNKHPDSGVTPTAQGSTFLGLVLDRDVAAH